MTELSLQELATQATLVFRGTVEQLGATTMDAVAVAENIAIVRVDEVLEAPESLASLSGTDITIQFSASPPTQTPVKMIFFTRPGCMATASRYWSSAAEKSARARPRTVSPRRSPT